MSGHSKWSTIKHKKAATDAKKGKAFTQVANLIAIAAREGGGDQSFNFKLRLAIDKAKSVNMPMANIERAIKKGTGEGGGGQIEEFTYEGYGPGGTAVLVETASDNKNRTVGEVRAAFSKYGGSLGSTGSVSYLFDQKGQLEISLGHAKNKDELELAIIDSGAQDFEEQDDHLIVYTKVADFQKVKEALEKDGIKTDSAEIAFIPKTEIKIDDENKARSVLKLVEALEDLDDVLAVHSNFDIPESLIKSLM